MDELKEYILTRPLKPVVKLNHLKTYLGGEALDLIKSYTHGSQLNEALETLENAYNKPDFIISEVYRNLKSLESVKSFKQIKAAKTQVQTLKVSLATLKTLGYEKELIQDTNLQNTFILVELEGKIPLNGYTARMIEKDAIKANKKVANLEDFVKFYTKLVDQHADAQYIRRQLEDVNKPTIPSTPRRNKDDRAKKRMKT